MLEPPPAPAIEPAPVVDEGPTPPRRDWRPERWAAWAFGAYVAAALPILMLGVGKYWWFFRDDWFFITDRQMSVHDLFEDHNGHWSTAPIVVFRLLWAAFGLTSYAPYKATVVVAHLVVVVCVRIIMRRYGVGPWLATAIASCLVLFGAGREDILWAFQIGFTGSIALLFLQWVLADRPEAGSRFDRRDLLGVLCGLVAVTAASPALPMIAALAATLFIRRGWRAAVLHAGPSTAAYLTWSLIVKPDRSAAERPPVGALADWVEHGVVSTFDELTGYRWAAILLGLAVVAGLVWALIRPQGDVLDGLEPLPADAPRPARLMSALRYRLNPVAAPLALFGAAVLFILLASQRAWFFGPQAASASRYLYAYTVFTVPLIGLSIQKLADRWRYAAPLLALLVVIGVPSNIEHFKDPIFGPAHHEQNRDLITNVLRSPAVEHAPDDLRPDPDPFVSPGLTVGFLRQAEADGKLPQIDTPIPSLIQPVLTIRLGLDQRSGDWVRHPCTTTEVERFRPEAGTSFYLETDVDVVDRTHAGAQYPTRLQMGHGNLVTVVAPDLDLGMSSTMGGPASVCVVD